MLMSLRKVFNGDGTYGLESIWMLQRNLSEQRRFALRMINQDGFSSNIKDCQIFVPCVAELDTTNVNALKREKPTVGWKKKNTNMELGYAPNR